MRNVRKYHERIERHKKRRPQPLRRPARVRASDRTSSFNFLDLIMRKLGYRATPADFG